MRVGHLDSQRLLPVFNPKDGLTAIAKKLRFASKQQIAVLNAPDGYLLALQPGLGDIATELKASESYDAVQLFVKDAEELRRLGPAAIHASRPDGLLWITYPKGGPDGKATDLPATPWWVRRDVLGELTSETGYRAVAMVAINDTWTALRFKRV